MLQFLKGVRRVNMYVLLLTSDYFTYLSLLALKY